MATAQRGRKLQRIGNCAANHHARTAPEASTASVAKLVSKATVRFSVLCSTIVSEIKRQNLNEVFDWCGPTSTVCFTVRCEVTLTAACPPQLGTLLACARCQYPLTTKNE